MKDFTLKSVRLVELTQVIDSIPLKELPSLKDIRLNSSLVEDLNAINKELADAVSEFNTKREEALKPVREEYAQKSKELDEEQKKTLASELDVKFLAENKWIEEEQKKLNELGEKELKVELSEEKFAKLKEWFEKYGTEKYLNKKVYLTIADALGL